MALHMKKLSPTQRTRRRMQKRNKPSTQKRLQRRESERQKVLDEGEKAKKRIPEVKAEIADATGTPKQKDFEQALIQLKKAVELGEALSTKLAGYRASR